MTTRGCLKTVLWVKVLLITGLFLGGALLFSPEEAAAIETFAKTYGGSSNAPEPTYAIQQTSDGGYIVAGITSFGAGWEDFGVLKLDSAGGVIWQNSYGGPDTDLAYALQQTSDGGYIVAGYTGSFGAGVYDFWVLKLDSAGGVIWQNTYGGSDDDYAHALQQTSDGGYIVAGDTYLFGTGRLSDIWLLKLDSAGGITWQKTYGGPDMRYDYAQSIQQTSDGGYIVAGKTNSFGAGGYDAWLLKLDSAGGVTWQKTYGGSGDDRVGTLQRTSDGGYIVAGATESFGIGNSDFWVLKLDSAGGVTWQKTYGGTSSDEAFAVEPTNDGGYIVAGDTASFGAGGSDVWVLKLDNAGGVTWQKTYGGLLYDHARSIQQTSDSGYIVAGETNSFGAGGTSDSFLLKIDANGNLPFFCSLVRTSTGQIITTSATGATSSATSSNSTGTITTTYVAPGATTITPICVCPDYSSAVTLTAGVPYNGTTVGALAQVSTYNCQPSRNESGPEKLHKITTTTFGTLTITLSNLSANLDLFLLTGCHANGCLAFGDTSITYPNAPAGTYYIAVDGYQGASGAYTLTVTHTEQSDNSYLLWTK